MDFNSMFSVPKFEPGSPFDLVDKDSPKVNVNLSSIQSLPYKLTSSQSRINYVDLKCLESTPGDIGNGFEAGDCLCLFLGPLAAVPSVVPSVLPPGPPVSVEELQISQDQAKNEGAD
ncbi:hypothetical protein DSO57_1025512 [Entomophthora muscae]|uniref:Uncharacterized protein n=1 Tax=Entomophthora muscae TaxID=34485 RepID=A0ACC2T2D8_9FUNG|nr:hypothetical protein DSO57_1025512 [Entomophthora muscae]